MGKTSTPFNKKTVKRDKPSRRVIENILNYSASLSLVGSIPNAAFIVVNN